MQTISFAFAGIVLIAGKSNDIKIATIPITTINSMSVNPPTLREVVDEFIQKLESFPHSRTITNLPADLECW
jgi:hypothetical protein